MRRIKILWHVIGILVLQAAFSAAPVLGQDEPGAVPGDTRTFSAFRLPNTQKNSATNQFLSDVWTDQKAIWTSPFHLNRKQVFTIVLPIAAAPQG